MNINFINYFLAVAETSSFTRAAERVHVTQPTLSAGIARLEELVGAPLFHRGRQVRLTDAGIRLLPHARTIVEEFRQLRRPPPPDRRHALRIGCAATIAPTTIASLLAGFALQAPEIDVSLRHLRQDRDGKAIAEGDDVAIAPASGEPQAGPVLLREPYLLAVPRSHRLATRDRCSIDELAELHFAIRRHCEVSDRAQAAFAEHGLRPPVRTRTADDALVVALVEAGQAVAFMPRSLIPPTLAGVAIGELPWQRQIQATTGAKPSASAQSFIRFAASHDWSNADWRLAH